MLGWAALVRCAEASVGSDDLFRRRASRLVLAYQIAEARYGVGLRDSRISPEWLGRKVFEHVQHIRAKNPAQDFLLVFDGRPMSYSMGLAQFRRCLHIHCGMTFENCLLFTLHSLKTTLLTYASQHRVDRVQRAAQGHHQLTDANQCVELYGRDDVQPQLACQRSILRGLRLLDGAEPDQDETGTEASSDGELDCWHPSLTSRVMLQ